MTYYEWTRGIIGHDLDEKTEGEVSKRESARENVPKHHFFKGENMFISKRRYEESLTEMLEKGRRQAFSEFVAAAAERKTQSEEEKPSSYRVRFHAGVVIGGASTDVERSFSYLEYDQAVSALISLRDINKLAPVLDKDNLKKSIDKNITEGFFEFEVNPTQIIFRDIWIEPEY